MPIKTSTSMSGFVASTPQLTRTESGDARLYMKVGQEHFTRNEDGSFTQGETSFHDFVMFRRAAEKAAQFTKGDKFVAEGYVHAYTVTDGDGQMFEREEFVGRKIGHDTAVTNYSVNRTLRQAAVEQGVPMIQQGSSQVGLATFQTVSQPAPVAVGM
ncbi:MAG: single-stranded DNA-binding protein [Promicromonosporaceae bacterium]|nr:single-stranded DNA-binding protein [Promicromonosporaceae bacterium]